MNMSNKTGLFNVSQVRVVFITDAYAGFGGTWTYYHDLVENLGGYLDHVELLCPPAKDSHNYAKRMSFPMPGDKTQKVFIPNFWQIGEKIRNIHPHIIVVSTPGPYGIIGMVQAKHLRIQLFVVFQTEFDKLTNIYWNRILYRLSKIYLDGIFKLFFRMGFVVMMPNPELKKRIRKMGAYNVEVMGTPIPKDFQEKPILPLRKEIASVLYLGRLAQEKNIDAILNSAERFQNLRFVIAGDGPLRDKVIERAKSLYNLEYLGWVPRQTVLSLIDQSDMLILPSKVEAFGTVALEAMARKRLVLVSPNCGIARNPLLSRGFFRIHHGESLASAIYRIKCMDHCKRQKIADLARQTAEIYNTETTNQWIELISRSLRLSKS